MKKRTALCALLLSALLLMTACTATAERDQVRLGILKGPTGMSAAHLLGKSEAGETKNEYSYSLAASPDVLVSAMVTGDLDIAAMPTNTAALLYQRTEGGVQALNVSTLGVLYIVERGDTVHSLNDLEGKTVVGAVQGSTADAVAKHLFSNFTAPVYVSEHAEAVAQAALGNYDLALLPEPFVTLLLTQDSGFRIALDLTREWENSGAATLVMGCFAVRREFAEQHPDAVEAFLEDYLASVAYTNENPAEAAQENEAYDIMAASVAEKAIPRANMVSITGGEMKTALIAFYEVLLEENPEMIGGGLPGDDFYYGAE